MATRLKTVRYWQHELKHNKTTFIIYSVLRFLVLVILVRSMEKTIFAIISNGKMRFFQKIQFSFYLTMSKTASVH